MAARLSYLDRDQLTPELQEVYDTLRQASGRVLNIYRLIEGQARSVRSEHRKVCIRVAEERSRGRRGWRSCDVNV